ncbi:MAG: hypothetical protein JST86_10460 [Bacteroidetes bacterium]|nr:hypothetical protein [Bacteroidota bacterium]
MPENTIDIYDKAEWHTEQNFPNDLDDFQSYVHTGMFLAWLIDTDLVSDEFKTEHRKEIEQFKKQKITGSQIFQNCCDGVLMLNELNELGNQFALPYFSLNTKRYLADYSKVLAVDLPSFYYVEDTWENYKKLKAVLDKTFQEWKTEHAN